MWCNCAIYRFEGKLWYEMDSLLFYRDTLDGVSNLAENVRGNEEDTDDQEEQCQPPA